VNPWHDVRLLNAIANGLMAVATVALLAAAGGWLIQRPAFALRTVIVEPAEPARSLERVNLALLRSSDAARLKGNFFTVELDVVRAAFESVPWVRRAQVRRIWPNTLHVDIEEHRALALWNDGRLVNDRGELFAANVAEAEADTRLLEFSGPAGSESQVTRRWNELREQLAPVSLFPEAVTLSSRYAWSARLDNGTTLLLGREQGLPIAERVDRWVALHPAVQSRLNREIVSVDLRYPNGFAIRAPGALDKTSADRSTARPAASGPRSSAPRNAPAPGGATTRKRSP
jgi:cell division protein FtsQ